MKKIFLIITIILSLIISPSIVNASSGSIKISSSSSRVIVGNTVTVTVTLSSNSALGAWEFDVNYDSSYLKLTSSNAENNGTYFVNAGDGSSKTKTYTLKFRALKSGVTNITVGSYDVYAFDKSSMSISKSNSKITLMTQAELEATYSKDNNLKKLVVEGYELDKEFSKDTLEYTVNVPTGTTSVKVIATEQDSKASVSGDGIIEVTEGLNTIPITVTAQNGSEKTYTLTVNVEDLNPIEVKVGNETYTIIKNKALLTAPATFTESTVKISEFDIPTFVNKSANLTLVGLKDKLGNIKLFVYENNEYKAYNELSLKNLLLIPVKFDTELDLIKTTVTINNESIDAYKYSENTEFVIINAKSLEDGKTNLYLYDTVNKTASRYDDTLVNEKIELTKTFTFALIGVAGIILVMFIIILCLMHSLRKKKKKIKKFIEKQEAKMEATRKLNDVVEEVKKITESEKPKIKQDTTELKEKETKEEVKLVKKEKKKQEKLEVTKIKIEENKEEDTEEVYDLFGDDKKKKRKKK
ncbi:MAG: cadherin-like beta sandwich domain-containing protein [Firmicutes bacterium]|nr:cadherin-like beta sandwich domain-containing protein [Bacillota bacterium]